VKIFRAVPFFGAALFIGVALFSAAFFGAALFAFCPTDLWINGVRFV
jgi:hypothetical protein